MNDITINDITFILPLGIETNDRLRNFLFTSNYLFKICPEANFLIHEMGPINHLNIIEHRNLTKIYTEIPKIDNLFHKTWCINRCLEKVKTKVVCIYDVDVLIPFNSIKQSISLIANGYDMVLPYGRGLFQKMILNFDECKKFEKFFNFNEFTKLNLNYSFYGHVQFFNTKTFIEVGGENEEFIGWGPEDQEKLYKIQELGYKVSYLDDYVWHIEHERFNSLSAIQMESLNSHTENVKIFDKIKNMSFKEKVNYYKEQKNKLNMEFLHV